MARLPPQSVGRERKKITILNVSKKKPVFENNTLKKSVPYEMRACQTMIVKLDQGAGFGETSPACFASGEVKPLESQNRTPVFLVAGEVKTPQVSEQTQILFIQRSLKRSFHDLVQIWQYEKFAKGLQPR